MIRLLLIFFCLPLFAVAQVYDDFSDGDFTVNPLWTGTVEKFKVNDLLRLQLNDTAAGSAYLITQCTVNDETEWRIWVKQAFSPSANNYGRIYLMSDQPDLSGNLNGYFIQMGESGSNDALELFRQDGQNITSVCRGEEGLISSSFSLNIKVTREKPGVWKMWVDQENNGLYQLQASGVDSSYDQTQYFGVFAHYTKSNASKFYWDDVYVGKIIEDTLPPIIQMVTVVSDSSLLIQADEPLDPATVLENENYLVDGSIGHPDSIVPELSKIRLYFKNKFEEDRIYHLNISNLSDLAGNIIDPFTTTFSFYRIYPFDIVFNEIFPDPNPVVGLPPFEFLELFNRTNHDISLNGWKLMIGNAEKVFTSAVLKANGYLIVGKETAADAYSSFGPFYGFGSFNLPNTGKDLKLMNNNQVIMDEVIYDETWYQDPEKENGGWSLEKIYPENLCSGGENWRASENVLGGTPGSINSVYEPVLLKPVVEKLTVKTEDVLALNFNQKMDVVSLSDPLNYWVDQDIGQPSAVFPDPDDASQVDLYFENSFKTGTLYSLTLKKELTNCTGISMADDTVIFFGQPEKIAERDVVINEVLFDPLADGEDYVELYNRSEKLLDLSSLRIGSVKRSPPDLPDTLWYPITVKQTVLFPESYCVLSKSPEKVKEQYFTENPQAFLRVDPFPSYNRDQGTVLLSNDSMLIDAMDYNEKMHFPLLQYTKGVSLERIDPEGLSKDPRNWHSASESAGFGTPGYQNSQYNKFQEIQNEVSVEPEVFSPDNDGHDDVLKISYHFTNPGNMISVTIFDKHGALVKRLVDHEYVGTRGVIYWDGITETNTKAPVGIYILLIKSFDDTGEVSVFKRSAVLATRW
jgi:hypothetical protein